MSAVTEGELKASALQPAAFLAKPTDQAHMLEVVRRFCDGDLPRVERTPGEA
jgi:hypothetical protein